MTVGLQPGDLDRAKAARPSMGKAQPLDARVRTLTGWKRMGELRVGDALASVDGRPSIVTGIYLQGGARCTASCRMAQHRMLRASTGGGALPPPTGRVLSTAEFIVLLRQGALLQLRLDRAAQRRVRHQELPPIDPWVLGAL